ncbi:MAG: methyl-accepting chemotaxis protein [Gallionella sp.]|nr:methyl-accepting chemotaxis protein [Gallionella sp.]
MKSIRLTIRAKITILAVSAVLFLGGVGAAATWGVYSLSQISNEAVDSNSSMFDLLRKITDVRGTFRSQVQEWKNILLRGNNPELYTHHHDSFVKFNQEVDAQLEEVRKLSTESALSALVSSKDVDELLKAHKSLQERYVAALGQFNPAQESSGQDIDKLVRGADKAFAEMINKKAADITEAAHQSVEASKRDVESSSSFTLWVTVAVLGIAVPLLIALGFFITRGIIQNLERLMGTITEINQGKLDARAETGSGDELAVLAKAFNELLDNRMATQARIETENEQLNDSVLGLLLAVAQLAKKDLTVKVPVSEDVTGAVADALNLFSRETSKTLQDVSNISADVTSASLKVQRQAESMLLSAADERVEVDLTEQSLSSAAHALDEIAELARGCNIAADNAVKTTQLALSTVINTVSGINKTRDVIRETEKRIKRLGERSQEISGVVNLINVIAERTHILALNASMHAASAGEAGRGFAVVADEVQRLAENARQATQQIAALVSNIQMETVDTVNTMNTAITQIVEGSRLAEQAGEQMQLTGDATADLAASVKQIAATSATQAKAGQELLVRAASIRRNSEHASIQLEEQSGQTRNLVEYAKQLLATVRVFKLPG